MADTFTDNRITFSDFLGVSEDDAITFRGRSLVAGIVRHSIDTDISCEIVLTDGDGNETGRMYKIISADDPDFAADVTALGGS